MHLDAHKPRQENVCFLLKKIADLKLDTGENWNRAFAL